MLSGDEQDLAELADLVMNVSKLIRARTSTATATIQLNETEGRVMRLVDLFPGCTPGDIAARARLQRTNVSTALSSLESKGMVTRTANGDRTVAVLPTQLAVDNLNVLKAAWAEQLAIVLKDDLASVRQCNRLLERLETRLNQVV